MKVWMVATYKINELKRLQENLHNQNFDYYNPKIITKKQNLSAKEESLFPGYIYSSKFRKLSKNKIYKRY